MRCSIEDRQVYHHYNCFQLSNVVCSMQGKTLQALKEIRELLTQRTNLMVNLKSQLTFKRYKRCDNHSTENEQSYHNDQPAPPGGHSAALPVMTVTSFHLHSVFVRPLSFIARTKSSFSYAMINRVIYVRLFE